MSSTQTQVLSHVGPIDWIDLAQRWVSNEERAVFIMVTALRGSAPRECGTWMLVSQSRIAGTLGVANWNAWQVKRHTPCCQATANGNARHYDASWDQT